MERSHRRSRSSHARLLLAGGCLAVLAAGCATPASPPEDRQAGATREAVAPELRRARMHYDMGAAHLQAGRTGAALRELLQAFRHDPTDERIALGLAEAYRRKGRLAETEHYLIQAIALRPDYHEAHLNLSALYIQTERFQEAAERAQLLVDDPTSDAPWRALTNLGWARLNLGQRAEARRDLELALDYREDYWPARLNLGILEAEEGRGLEAIEQFERVLEARPGPFAEAEVHYRLAEAFVSLGQRERAIDHLSEAKDRRPSGPWGKRSAEYLERLQ